MVLAHVVSLIFSGMQYMADRKLDFPLCSSYAADVGYFPELLAVSSQTSNDVRNVVLLRFSGQFDTIGLTVSRIRPGMDPKQESSPDGQHFSL